MSSSPEKNLHVLGEGHGGEEEAGSPAGWFRESSSRGLFRKMIFVSVSSCQLQRDIKSGREGKEVIKGRLFLSVGLFSL